MHVAVPLNSQKGERENCALQWYVMYQYNIGNTTKKTISFYPSFTNCDVTVSQLLPMFGKKALFCHSVLKTSTYKFISLETNIFAFNIFQPLERPLTPIAQCLENSAWARLYWGYCEFATPSPSSRLNCHLKRMLYGVVTVPSFRLPWQPVAW